MDRINQSINGYHIPSYMEEILTNNYCPHFLRMSMVRENDAYRFRYVPEQYRKIEIEKLDTYEKLVLLRSIITLNDRNEAWLINAENYLIEPELIYCINNCVEDGSIRMLFYPDNKRMNFDKKIVLFSDKISDRKNKAEMDVFRKFHEVAEKCDRNRTRLFLDKSILRFENFDQQSAC